MSVEIAAAALLGSQLLDAKYQIKHDVMLVQHVVRLVVPFLVRCARGRASFWYTFELLCQRYPNNRAIAFPRPAGADGRPAPPVTINPHTNARDYDKQFRIENYSYKEFYDIVLRLSYILVHDYGVTADQTIALDCMNKPLFLFLWMALWNIGALPLFLNFNTRDKALVHCLKILNVLQVFIDPDCLEPIKLTEAQIRQEAPQCQLHYINEPELLRVITSPLNRNMHRAEDHTRRPNDSDHDCCCLIYTLGTTGLPKAAMMLWRKAFMAALLFGYIMKITHKLNVLTAMPLYHLTAAMLGVCPSLISGACILVLQKFLATTFWTQAKLCRLTHMQYVGEVCRYLLHAKPHPDQDAHSITIAYGNGLRKDIWMDFKRRFHIKAIGEFYALTESPIATTSLQYGDYGVGACRKYGLFINFILLFQQVLVKMDPEDENEIWRDHDHGGFATRAQPGEPGELLMKILNPKNVEKTFQGYYGNKKATSSKVVRDVFRQGDAWFRTGDLLKTDADGLLYFVDRLGDTFRWKSENVSATEVENELMGLKAIKGSVVVGVKVPNHEGRAGFAVVEPRDEFGDKVDELLSRIYQHTSRALPSYAVPQFIKVIEQIESQHNHKVPKNQYKKQVLPKGESGDEKIYWLNQGHYEELTQAAWDKIVSGSAKL